ncbi:hypothetical protein ACKRZS_000132 [Fusarium odoratissimum]|uniref:Uncharacterized protein n=2 Tax=Fusarium oxysporum species complex TaxID=171631 RepID=X0LMN1_FUSO5|nr:uncharacterized protein FOIG_00147 [Fusarium odoratissimum NRRL 54006]EXM09830.1 hypothetical protein FOIG_00147 [Fusarium odoratissimum NRRL 54006]TXC05148.1 hypothetical protein FocTR4_00001992 [Fusarium oxysporum f. sp. cubense]
MPSNPHVLHPDMETIIILLDKQPTRMFTRNCIPPKDPPPGTPEPCVWRCHECGRKYKISVTSRCIRCPSYNDKPPYMYLSGNSPDGQPTREYRKSPLSGSSPDGKSATKTRKSPTNRTYSKRPSPSVYNYDYEFWGQYNDWKRFGSEYEARPERWESRIKHNFDGKGSAPRRAERYKFEVETRTYFTEERLERMLKRKHNCELDCDYPSQCQTERYEASRKGSRKVTGGKVHPPRYGDDKGNAGKMPLCELLPGFDQEITSPEDVDDEDVIFAAYKRDVDAWYASTLASLAK